MPGKATFKKGQIFFIQIAIVIYSFCGVFQKLASRTSMFSWNFIFFYGCSIGIMMIYAVLWQIILRKVPLSTAYSNRAVAMIWSLVWSALIFRENIHWNQVLGAAVIFFGVYKVMTANYEE